MRRAAIVSFAIVATLLVATAPAAASTTTAIGSQHTTDADFNNATTLENVTVSGGTVALNTIPSDPTVVSQDGTTWLKFDEGSGTTAADSIGSDDGTLRSDSWGTGGFEGYYMDDELADLPEPMSTGLDDSDQFTLVVLVRPTGAYDTGRTLLSLRTGTDIRAGYGASTGDISVNNDEFTFQINGAVWQGLVVSAPTAGEWHLWTMVYDGSNMDLYYWDQDQGSTDAPDNFDPVGLDNRIGANTRLDTGAFMVFNDDLTSSEVSDLADFYNESLDFNQSNGKYISQTHSVDNAVTGKTNLTLDNATAHVTWLADTNDDGTFETEAASSTYTTSGNKSLDISGTSSTDWRVNVTFVPTGENPTAELHDEAVLFTNHGPEANNASASPDGASTNNEDVQLSIDVADGEFPLAQGDQVGVEFYVNGSLVATKQVTSNQTVSTTAGGLSNGSHTWHVELDDDYDGTASSTTFTFDVLHYAPSLDNSSVSPADGADLTDRSVTLSIDAEDVDFAEPSGDSVDLEYFLDGSSVGTDTITSNGTSSLATTVSTGGEHTWYVVATDEYGLSQRSANFTMNVPAAIEIRNETGEHELINNSVTVEGRFFSGDLIFERSTTTGKINMTGLPADREYVLTITSPKHYTRTVVIRSLYEQSTIYLLQENQSAHLTEFQIDDQSGDYSPASSTIFVEKPINESSTLTWTTIAGDTFGAEGSFKVYLQSDKRYNISVENEFDETAELGPYVADSAGVKVLTITEDDTIEVDELEVFATFDPAVGWLGVTNASILNVTIRSDQGELSSYTWTVTHTNGTTGATTTLVTQSGSASSGETLGAEVNLTGHEGGTIESNITWTLSSSSTTFSDAVVYRIRESLGGDHTILAVVEDVPGRLDSSTVDQALALLAMAVIVIGVAAAAAKLPLSTEVVGLLAVGGIAVFAAFGWLEWTVFFAGAVGWVALVGLRRGL